MYFKCTGMLNFETITRYVFCGDITVAAKLLRAGWPEVSWRTINHCDKPGDDVKAWTPTMLRYEL